MTPSPRLRRSLMEVLRTLYSEVMGNNPTTSPRRLGTPPKLGGESEKNKSQ